MRPRNGRTRGFTLIELVVVMALLGLLLSIALPRFMDSLARGKAQVQQKDLATMREAIDKYFGDRGRYPDSLEELVTARYLRAIPPDPFTEKPEWEVVPPTDGRPGSVYDVRPMSSSDARADAPAPPAPDAPEAPAEGRPAE